MNSFFKLLDVARTDIQFLGKYVLAQAGRLAEKRDIFTKQRSFARSKSLYCHP